MFNTATVWEVTYQIQVEYDREAAAVWLGKQTRRVLAECDGASAWEQVCACEVGNSWEDEDFGATTCVRIRLLGLQQVTTVDLIELSPREEEPDGSSV